MSNRFAVFQPENSPTGVGWIQDTFSGELMHPLAPPFEEATKVYVQQIALDSLLLQAQDTPIVLWDVGLGAAANAMAAIRCAESISCRRRLVVYSFESDLSSLRLAVDNLDKFSYLGHPGPQRLLQDHTWSSPNAHIQWHLVQGNFLESFLGVEKPTHIFYDPFSFRTDTELWTANCFNKIYQYISSGAVTVVTYSTSTAVRAALLVAGFWVGYGRGIGTRPESTVAFTRPQQGEATTRLLGAAWYARWQRSSSQHPYDIEGLDIAPFQERVSTHSQFLL
jgi:queuine tRNA-ribosyltransferase